MASVRTIPLWPDVTGYNDSPQPPRMDLFLPDNHTPDARLPVVLVFPGGGYSHQADHEGAPFAKHFCDRGCVSLVVYYRVAPNTFPAPYADGCRAVRLVRSMSSELGIDLDQLAIMGFSAGGHLVSTVATQPDLHHDPHDNLVPSYSARPNRLIMGYPVISFVNQPHLGSAANLLGQDALGDNNLRRRFSNELWVTQDNPPTFIFHTADDQAVPVANSLNFAQACNNHGVDVALHVFPHGPHGVGLAADNPQLAPWMDMLDLWMADVYPAS